ncbi:MAG TPA: diacylglycerol kinase family protein [Actinomycetota bacterium]
MSSPFGTLVVIADHRVPADVSRALRLLDDKGLASRVLEVEDEPTATEAARATLASGERFVVALGDDATDHDIINGMMSAESSADRPILGVLPAGGEVDFIKTFGLPPDLPRAAGHMEGAGTIAVDVGKVTCASLRGDGQSTRYFANVAQVGLGASMQARAERFGNRSGRVRQFLGFWLALARFRPARGRVVVDGRSIDEVVRDVVVANCQFHRGGIMVSPRSWPSDGVLDVLVMTGPKSEAFTELPKMYRGEHVPHRNVTETRGRTISVETERPLLVEADGRILGRTPATFEVLPQRISVKI